MPTPPIPVLHALLTSLSLPVRYPSTLAAVPPTLLLLILERQTSRLSLPPELRSPRTRAAEVELTKILVGSLAVEVGMDLGAVDPARLVGGSEPDLAALIMALAVVARRGGVQIRLPSEVEEHDCDISWESLDDSLEEPREPAPTRMSSSTSTRLSAFTHAYTTPPRWGGGRDTSAISSASSYDRQHAPSPAFSRESRSRARRTVLQAMVEEFGLSPT